MSGKDICPHSLAEQLVCSARRGGGVPPGPASVPPANGANEVPPIGSSESERDGGADGSAVCSARRLTRFCQAIQARGRLS